LSVAIGFTKDTVAVLDPASVTAALLDGQVMEGFSVSTMVIENEHAIEYPALSDALHVTDVVPTGYVSPGFMLHVTTGESTLSTARGGAQVTTADPRPLSLLCVMLVGHCCEKVGGWLSVTVTVRLHDAVLPAVSAVLHKMVFAPRGYSFEAEMPVHVTVGETSTLSLAVAVLRATVA
jgi:hypothetical protein